jgi:hypothetical protein
MPISTTTGVGASSKPGYSRTDLGLCCRPANAAATLKIAIFTLRLLLFYIVNNGALNRGLSVLSRVHSDRDHGRKENRYEGAD